MAAGEQHEHDDEDVVIPEPEGEGAASSILDQLRAEREAAANDQAEDWEVPNNGGILWLTARLLSFKRQKQFGQALQVSKGEKKELVVAAEIVHECAEAWLRDPRTGARLPWPNGAEALRFGPELLAYLQVPPLPANAKPSDYVRVVFAPVPEQGGELRETAITAFVNGELMPWMNASRGAAAERLAGE